MARVETSVDIRAPVAAVFEAATDPRRGQEWNPNIVDVTNLSDYPVGQGTTWQQVAMLMGRPSTLQCRVASFDAPREGTLEISGAQQAQVRTVCTEIADGTRLVQVVDFEPPGGVLGKMLGGVATAAVRKELKESSRRLKAVLERESVAVDGSGSS